MSSRLCSNIEPIARSLAAAIIRGKPDARMWLMQDGSIRLKMGVIIPTASNAVPECRKRLRAALRVMLEPHGWKEVLPNRYSHR